MRRLILAAFLSVSLLTGGCAAVAVKAVEADIAKQQAWTAQMEQVVNEQIMDYRVEIARLAKTDNGFKAAMDMRSKLLAFMDEWRPDLIIERFFDRLRKIRSDAKGDVQEE